MEDETWRPAIVGIAGLISVLLVYAHVHELKWLRVMVRVDRRTFRRLYWIQAAVPVLILLAFETMIWTSLTRPGMVSFEHTMYTALTCTIFLAALRAVLLVEASFSAIVGLHRNNHRE
jgi:hypothetical protein